MRLLDLFCGAGGAAMGYYRAGFADITGIDNRPQKRYPFRFIHGDAIEYVRRHGREYDIIHASPPCQRYSIATPNQKKMNHPDLIEPVRKLLVATGAHYVIENVVGAPLISPIMLCGIYFGLKVYRHRLFECSFFIMTPPHKPHNDQTPRKAGSISPKGFVTVAGHIRNTDYCRRAMSIDWMTGKELVQAIPPAYTEFIARYVRKEING